MSEEIRERVIFYRKRNGLTQVGLAKLMGMNRNTYAYHEKNGKFNTDILITISRILDVSLDDLTINPLPQKPPLFSPIEPKKPGILNDTDIFQKENAEPELTFEEKRLINIFRFVSNDKKEQIRVFVNNMYQEERNK